MLPSPARLGPAHRRARITYVPFLPAYFYKLTVDVCAGSRRRSAPSFACTNPWRALGWCVWPPAGDIMAQKGRRAEPKPLLLRRCAFSKPYLQPCVCLARKVATVVLLQARQQSTSCSAPSKVQEICSAAGTAAGPRTWMTAAARSFPSSLRGGWLSCCCPLGAP